MKTRSLVTVLALVGLPLTSAPASGAEAPLARSIDRAPQQVATLMRGYAAGNGWTLEEEQSLNSGRIITMRLCHEFSEGTSASHCGQFAILENGAGSEIVLLHVATPTGEALGDEAIMAFAALLDTVSARYSRPEDGGLSCGSHGCP